ncbi:hypothetical protein B0H13DRAFT_2360836 [Mycena leptocephala]|nr:hypothetical protein B0H13DRAFT_2360836 [Mycena leptocephala]
MDKWAIHEDGNKSLMFESTLSRNANSRDADGRVHPDTRTSTPPAARGPRMDFSMANLASASANLYSQMEAHTGYIATRDATHAGWGIADVLASFSKSLLTDPNLLPDLFLYIQRTGRFHSIFGDFKQLEHLKDK